MTIQEFAADHAIHRIQVSTTVTRRPGNSSLAAFTASALSAAKSGVTAMPSGRSPITVKSGGIAGSYRGGQ